MSPFLCKKHGMQTLVLTSPEFSERTKSCKKIKKSEALLLTIKHVDSDSTYYIDFNFFNEFIPERNKENLILLDRNRSKKELNDRLIIQKILKEMVSVCPECLKESIE